MASAIGNKPADAAPEFGAAAKLTQEWKAAGRLELRRAAVRAATLSGCAARFTSGLFGAGRSSATSGKGSTRFRVLLASCGRVDLVRLRLNAVDLGFSAFSFTISTIAVPSVIYAAVSFWHSTNFS